MLKILLVVAVILFGIWLFKKDRRPPPPTKPTTSGKTPAPARALPILPCSHCGTHTDAREMVHGQLGVYCSAAHCQLSGDRIKP